ncbi:MULTISPECIES: hypothetical protein [Streptomyces]|uniref:Uncharacterized protein n=1 Tax=Streptomyces radicis TaxID=1750517 RepID=A0A3A9VVT4_9ACTN|nr:MULTISPECIES: hypothetical protein [Streptomyces]RBM10752.1 hypothetical protein DEH69_22690 [Streptomyces sp. PT12]RKN04870.1 hypothetical protein D7319_27110 [Streptomyces radicis]RKN25380.1 hypothetical protein D7318_09270 [Streptomyces radicis]
MSKIIESVVAVAPEELSDQTTGEFGAVMPVQATPGLVAFGVGFAGGAGVAWLGVQAYEAGIND